MVLSEIALRRWKLATYVVTGATFWHLVFYNEYQMPGYEGKHCFTDIQVAYHNWIDRNVFGRKGLTSSSDPTSKSETNQQ